MHEVDCDIAGTCRQLYQNYDGPTPSYGSLWAFVASGRIQAMRVGRRWVIRGADLPVIAAHYKLTRKRSADVAA